MISPQNTSAVDNFTCQRLIYFLNNGLRVRPKILVVRVVEGFFDDKYNRQNKRVSERCSHIFTFDFCVITLNSFLSLL